MRTRLILIAALGLLLAGCSGIQAGPADMADAIPSTSYLSGYGLRPYGPVGPSESQLDWGW